MGEREAEEETKLTNTNMTAKKIAGYGILVLLFLSFFVIIAVKMGLMGAVLVFAGTALIASILYFAIWLIVD